MGRILDSDGRLFGRLNIIDAIIGVFVLLLVPLAYATYLLFRTPAPTITSVEPAPLTMTEERFAQGTPLAAKFKVRGTGLRPVLRARIGSKDAIAFIFEDPTSADVLVGDVPPGKHDLVLLDGVQEVARAAGAITIPEIASPSAARVALAGTLLDVDKAALDLLKTGARFPSATDARVEILAVDDPTAATLEIINKAQTTVEGKQHRRALIAVRCETNPLQPRECAINNTVLLPGITFILPDTPIPQRFTIDQVVPVTPPKPVTLRLRLVGAPEVLALVKEGDVDQPHLAIDQRGVVIRTVGQRRMGADPAAALVYPVPPVPPGAPIASLDVTATAGLDKARDGWRYRGDAIRAGGRLVITTPDYSVRAVVLSLGVDEDDPEQR